MSRNNGTFNFSSNFEVLTKAPLDARMLVDNKSDLILPSTWQDNELNIWLFDGAIVSVGADPSIANRGIYFLKDAVNYTNIENWVLAGSQGDVSINFLNVGDGSAGVFAGIDASGVKFRTISGSGPVVVSEVGNEIIISIDSSINVGVNGGVWFSDMTPQNVADNVGDKVFSSDGKVLDSCQTSTQDVTLSILALPGNTNYKPVIKVGVDIVTMSEELDKPLFTGNIDISLNDVSTLRVDHEDGAWDILNITYDTPAAIQTAIFTGGYPGTGPQTELKENDTFDIRITSDVDFVAYQIDNYGALKPVAETSVTSTSDLTVVDLIIANRGTTTTDLGFKVRVKKSTGTWSAWFLSETAGSTDGTNLVKLNNTYPTVAIGSTINYPASQEALKGNEIATVANTVSDADVYSYASPGTQLTITNPALFEASKTVTRLAGGYNIVTDNLTLTATRSANDATRSASTVVWLADTNATISISSPTRMISGGNDGTTIAAHEISIISTQQLLSTGTVTLANVTNAGSWATSSTFTTSDDINYINTLNVVDDDDKGLFSWGSFSATNLAGQSVSSNVGQTQYNLGGFKSRTVTVAAFGTDASINVAVIDYSKILNTLDWSGKAGGLPNKRPIGTTAPPPYVGGWAIDVSANNPTTINILDTATAESVSVASSITIEETE